MAEFLFHKGSPTYLHTENADVMNISQFMAQNLRQAPPPLPPPPKHTFEISEGESVEIEKIVAAEKKDGQLYYKVKWVKYTWEAEESIQHLPHLIDGYWREHFYQNINQAVIDPTGIAAVSAPTATETDFSRNKPVVVQPDGEQKNVTSTETQTPSEEGGEKSATTLEQGVTGVNGGAVLTAAVATTNVGEHSDVILEFSMPPQTKVEHSFPTRAQASTAGSSSTTEKRPRRSYPLERKYVCSVCNKAFDRNTSLTRHMLVHTREKPYKCQLCDKAFSQNAHLKRHILIHIGQKSYQCNKCGKMFIEKGGLARHEATHSTDKPWVCNQCGKAFVLNEYLQRHLFLHTGQKPYQCNECGRLFADGSSWRAHKLTHNKEKKYKCNICQKLLKCKRNFKKHVQAHSDEKEMKHKCEICGQQFLNKKTFKEHTRNAVRNHRCPTCNRFLRSRERFLAHMEFHDPMSEKYDPTAHIEGEEMDIDVYKDDDDDERKSDDPKTEDEDKDEKSDVEQDDNEIDHNVTPTTAMSPTATSPTDRAVGEEILSTILETEAIKTTVGDDVTEQTPTGPAVSALTALMMKNETSSDVREEGVSTATEIPTMQTTEQSIQINTGGKSTENENVDPVSVDATLGLQLGQAGTEMSHQQQQGEYEIPQVPLPQYPTDGQIQHMTGNQTANDVTPIQDRVRMDSVSMIGGGETNPAAMQHNMLAAAGQQQQQQQRHPEDSAVSDTIILITQNSDVNMQGMKI